MAKLLIFVSMEYKQGDWIKEKFANKRKVDRLIARMRKFDVMKKTHKHYISIFRFHFPEYSPHQIKNMMSRGNNYFNEELYRIMYDFFNPEKCKK